MTRQDPLTSQGVPVPHFDSIVPQSGHDFLIVVLETIDSFGVLTSTIDSLQIMFAKPPIALDSVYVFNNGGVKSSIK